MSEANPGGDAARELDLSPVDRVSDVLFGLFMAPTFVRAVFATDAEKGQIRSMVDVRRCLTV